MWLTKRKLELLAQVLRISVGVRLVELGRVMVAIPVALGRERLVLQTADREHLPGEPSSRPSSPTSVADMAAGQQARRAPSPS